MSWEATNHVWSRRHPYSGYKVVLLCIADMLPSIHGRGTTWAVDFQTISCRTDLSLRVVKEVVGQLEQDGDDVDHDHEGGKKKPIKKKSQSSSPAAAE